MTLLSDAIEASGGVTRWDRLTRFTLQLSIDGALLSRAGHGGRFKNVVAEGSTQRQLVRFTGFTDPGKSYSYEPERVTIEDADGKVLETRREPSVAFHDKAKGTQWDELSVVYFCGLSIWNYLATPFLLAHPDVKVEELPPWRERDQEWRRLRAMFPPRLVTPSPEQTFYFNSKGLQRRTDQQVLGEMVAQYSWAHQAFNGLVIPTLRRSLTVNRDGTALTKPALLDVEIFDAIFE